MDNSPLPNLLEYFENELKCGCCYELMVDPTTLDCGHSFCRLCLAKWWHTSKNINCLICRQPSQGFPEVAVQLRNTIKKLFPEKLLERQDILNNDQSNKLLLRKFADYGKKINSTRGQQEQTNRNGHNFKNLVLLLVILCAVIVCFYEIIVMFKGRQDSLVRKPVQKWSQEDVAFWVSSLGPWAKYYEVSFQDSGIDGSVLLEMTEKDLMEPPMKMSISFHRRIFLKELEALKRHGKKVPADLWEYKMAYPGRTIFLLWGFREFPRLTFAYIYLFYNEQIFLPILQLTSEIDFSGEMDSVSQQIEKNIPNVEYLRFAMRVILLPYYLIGKCAFAWLPLNYLVAGLAIVTCVLMTSAECTKIKWILRGGWKELPSCCLTYTSQAIGNGILQLIVWQFLPSIICDIFFYWMLLGCPLYGWQNLIACISENVEEENHRRRNMLLWLWEKLRERIPVVLHVRQE